MVSEDRRLQLADYEVFRLGGAELVNHDAAQSLLQTFFDQLLDKPRPGHL